MTKDAIPAALSPRRSLGNWGSEALSISRVRPAYQQVADQLLDLILDGSLAADDRLPSEAELSSIFGVSRSTVREALRALASRDLLRTTRGATGGTFVRRVEPDQVSDYLQTSLGLMSGADDVSVREMLEAREILEVPAARLAASRRTDEHLDAMREAITREKQIRGRGRRFREHRNFHAIVLQSSQNGLLALMTEPVFGVLQSKSLDPEPGFWENVNHDHEAIFTAISDRDPDAAAQMMLDHLVRLRGTYRDSSPRQGAS